MGARGRTTPSKSVVVRPGKKQLDKCPEAMPPCCSRALKRSIARLHGGRNAKPRDVLAATQKRNETAAGLSARRFHKIKWKPRVAVAKAAPRGRGHDRNASGVPLANVSRTQTRSNCNKIKKKFPN